MKTVNIHFKNRNKAYGPFYLIHGLEELNNYWLTIREPRFKSAIDYMFFSEESLKLPTEQLAHLYTKSRNDYGEQVGLLEHVLLHREDAFENALDTFPKKVYQGMKRAVENFSTIIVNQYGGFQIFYPNEMTVTDGEVESPMEVEDVTKAVFKCNTTSDILVLENANNLSLKMKDKLWEYLRTTIHKSDQIYYFDRISSEQVKILFEQITKKYNHICFETTFFKSEQVLKFIKMILKIEKPLNFYICSHIDVQDIIDENCSQAEKEQLQKHSFIMM